MTEQNAKDLGYELVKEFPHDQYHTRRYQKGVLELEFTYVGEKLQNLSLTIQEIPWIEVDHKFVKSITPILGQIQPE